MPPRAKKGRLVMKAVEIPIQQSNSIDPRPSILPAEFSPCLNAQKRQILVALRKPPSLPTVEADDQDEPNTNDTAAHQLKSLLEGTVHRGEGNSCLLIGPRGSGKTRLLEEQLEELQDKAFVIRLSGWAQSTDRLAMREIAYQLTQQTGSTFLLQDDEEMDTKQGLEAEPDDNPFLVNEQSKDTAFVSLPPASHLPALISVLPTLSRPTIVVLDSFDLFSLHPRQSLLYCLLDTAQSCRSDAGNKGIGVIGMTSRLDANSMLEKRVKSRFSGRIFRTTTPTYLKEWENTTRLLLLAEPDLTGVDTRIALTWKAWWKEAVNNLLELQSVRALFQETYGHVRDMRVLSRLLTALVAKLTPSSPFPSAQLFSSVVEIQRMRSHFPFMHRLPYPALCLLIASVHADTTGHTSFNFEMLYDAFQEQVRAALAAPVQTNGPSIGMVKCSREILLSAWETLIAAHVFIPVAAASLTMTAEFVKYRCAAEPDEIRRSIEKTAQINLKKWLSKVRGNT